MTHRETLEQYRLMTNAERAAITCRLIRENWPALYQGPAEVVARRFERLNQENDLRNRNMLLGLARLRDKQAGEAGPEPATTGQGSRPDPFAQDAS